MKKIPVLTKNELDDFLSTEAEIAELEKKNYATREKMDEILGCLVEEWHMIEGSHYGESLWIDNIDYRGDEIHFESNWGKIYDMTLDDLLNPEKFIETFRKVKEDEEKKKTASFIKRKQKQAKKKEENEKLKSLGFDTKNIQKLKKQVLRLYDESAQS